MSRIPTRLTALVAATAAAGISGAAIAGAATSGSSTTTPTPPAQNAGPASGCHGGRSMHADLAAVAKDLGVTEAQLQSALQAARPQGQHKRGAPGKPGDADHQAREAAMYAAVAKALGKDAAAVQTAFEAHRPARP